MSVLRLVAVVVFPEPRPLPDQNQRARLGELAWSEIDLAMVN